MTRLKLLTGAEMSSDRITVSVKEYYALKMTRGAEPELDAYYPIEVEMPCGNVLRIADASEIPPDNVPCPCGDEGHWLVHYTEAI